VGRWHMQGRAWGRGVGSLAGLLWAGIALAVTPDAGETAVRDVVSRYERAIETKDVTLFRSVKPNLSGEEEKRLRRAFESTRSQEVTIAIESIRFEGSRAEARLSRRDTLDGSIVSSFPQTLRLSRTAEGWVIEEIGR
jgi:hypothetical protein